jgi:hypothetical protein
MRQYFIGAPMIAAFLFALAGVRTRGLVVLPLLIRDERPARRPGGIFDCRRGGADAWQAGRRFLST